MREKSKIILIHGGNTFRSKRDYLSFLRNSDVKLLKNQKWQNEYLDNELGEEYDIIRPIMPLKENAKYTEWKIFFEKYLQLVKTNYILIGNSLGGIFLAKYLSENKLINMPQSVFFVCPPFDNTLLGEELLGGFKLKSDLSIIERNCNKVHFMFSKDDNIVPINHSLKYKKRLPNSHFHIYESKNGHFKISKFPELIELIKIEETTSYMNSN